jgi:putative transposase
MAGTYHSLLYHLVFSTKNRANQITPQLRPRLYEYLGGIIRSENGLVYGIGGTSDHVHILARYRADDAVANLMRNLKSNSSLWVHRAFPELREFAWQTGYGAFSVSFSQVQAVGKYIATQESHHKRRDYRAELLALLDRHRVEYDPKYVFD